MTEQWIRKTLDLVGRVQGVSLRATLCGHARTEGLGGWVQNQGAATVRLVLEGPSGRVLAFVENLPRYLSPLAHLDAVTTLSTEPLEPGGTTPFTIRSSDYEDEAGGAVRSSPGEAPTVITLDHPLRRAVLAMGADMKNAIAVGCGAEVTLAPHTGDLDLVDGVERLEQEARAMPQRLAHGVAVVGVDLHPDMRSTRVGRRLAAEWKLPVVEIQHHHAHAAACLAENGRQEGLVLVMDGMGWGGDGTIWGAELLELRKSTFRRLASYSPVPLPGGDAAVRRPARQVVGRWIHAGIRWIDRDLHQLAVTREEADVWGQQCEKQINAPLTHAAGRLFDSFSAVLGLAPVDISHEGEPAIRLEAEARKWRGASLPELPFAVVDHPGLRLIDWAPAIRMLAGMPLKQEDAPMWAMAVHDAVARAAVAMLEPHFAKIRSDCVGLSGGVFANRILNERLETRLQGLGVTVLRHRHAPPGDACIALGQAVIAGLWLSP